MEVALARTPKRLIAFSNEESAADRFDREQIEVAEKRHRSSMSRFEQYFSRSLDGAQITAAQKLLADFEVRHRSGNATPSYDGVPPPQMGPKDPPSDYVLDAGRRIDACRKVCSDMLTPYPLFRMLEMALIEDLTASQIGHKCLPARPNNEQWSDRQKRRVGSTVIELATQAIIPVYNARRK